MKGTTKQWSEDKRRKKRKKKTNRMKGRTKNGDVKIELIIKGKNMAISQPNKDSRSPISSNSN